MLISKKKQSRSKLNLKLKKSSKLNFGVFGIKVLNPIELSPKHLVIVENILKKYTKKQAHVISRLNFNKTTTTKGSKARMGKGKGSIDKILAQVSPGFIIVEVSNINLKIMKHCFSKIKKKLPIKAVLVFK
jgi:large subunit ribosomal protein L16